MTINFVAITTDCRAIQGSAESCKAACRLLVSHAEGGAQIVKAYVGGTEAPYTYEEVVEIANFAGDAKRA